MEYQDAIRFLEGRRALGMKPGLERVLALLECFGNPQDGVPAIHVAGTNGKGSTCAFLERIYRENGYKTGLFTSPFLLFPTEMFRINGAPIDRELFASLVCEAADHCQSLDGKGLAPTEYEIYAVLALVFFKRQACVISIIEVGMGGTWDCTNVLTRKVASVITKISYDHTDFLGKTLGEIAAHKAGIIVPGIPVFTWPQDPEAMAVVANTAKRLGCTLHVPDFSRISLRGMDKYGSTFDDGDHASLHISIPGVHMIGNATLACETASALSDRIPVTEQALASGLSQMRWPARFELLGEAPDIILDSAHNVDGVSAFVETYRALYGDKKASILFGVMKDKEYEEMVRLLSGIAASFTLVTPDNPRALSADILKETVDKYCEKVMTSDTIKSALLENLSLTLEDGVICALGSMYYLGGLREIALELGIR